MPALGPEYAYSFATLCRLKKLENFDVIQLQFFKSFHFITV